MEAAVKFAVWLHGCRIVELEIECAGELAIERVVKLAVELAVKLVIKRVVELAVTLAVVEVRGIERENVGLWNGYIVLYIIQECGVNPLFILCSQTHDIIKLISNIPSVFLNKKLR